MCGVYISLKLAGFPHFSFGLILEKYFKKVEVYHSSPGVEIKQRVSAFRLVEKASRPRSERTRAVTSTHNNAIYG